MGSEQDKAPENGNNDATFVRHIVSKHDTMAGVAIRYGVSVLDIKQANGLLSETAMFAMDSLVIPLHRRKDSSKTNRSSIARFVGGLGRRELDPQFMIRPGSKALGPVAEGTRPLAESAVRTSSPTGSVPSRCHSDGYFMRETGEAELNNWEQSSERVFIIHPKKESFANDSIRRRRSSRSINRPVSCSPRLSTQAPEVAAGETSGSCSSSNRRYFVNLPSGSKAATYMKDYLKSVTKLFTRSNAAPANGARESIIQKIKRVANQPALAGQSFKLGMFGESAVASSANSLHRFNRSNNSPDLGSRSSSQNMISKERSKIE